MNASLLMLLLAIPAADPNEKPSPFEERAKEFVTALDKGRFSDASKDFSDAMKMALPGDKLAEIWKQIIKQVGPLEKQLSARSEKSDPFDIVYVRCKFEKMTLDVKVVYDKQQKLTGLNFLPADRADNKDRFPTPPYAKPDSYRESQAKVGTGEWVLPGTLTVPKGDGPFPAVVLVHGSGPQDRDETLGLTKTFRDLAWGLASNGIAVLRYEKRTKEHALKMLGSKTLTVKEETVDDALLAAEALRKSPGIDPKRVFIIGHSQGAMMAPRMALADKSLAGIVMLAAPSRPLEDVTLEQTGRMLKNRDLLSQQGLKLIEALDHIARLYKEGKLTDETSPEELLRLSPKYWRSLYGFTTVPDAQKLEMPILILQGENDVQVTMVDFAGWQKALKSHPNATLKSYPKLGHTFTPYDPMPGAEEGSKPANVAPEVIADIAAWIKK